jgi:hypothetical protein
MNGTNSYLGDKRYYSAHFCQISFKQSPFPVSALKKDLIHKPVPFHNRGQFVIFSVSLGTSQLLEFNLEPIVCFCESHFDKSRNKFAIAKMMEDACLA